MNNNNLPVLGNGNGGTEFQPDYAKAAYFLGMAVVGTMIFYTFSNWVSEMTTGERLWPPLFRK